MHYPTVGLGYVTITMDRMYWKSLSRFVVLDGHYSFPFYLTPFPSINVFVFFLITRGNVPAQKEIYDFRVRGNVLHIFALYLPCVDDYVLRNVHLKRFVFHYAAKTVVCFNQ